MRLNIYGIEALTKFLDALTTQQSHQFIVVRTDSYQAYLPSNERGFIVDIYDDENHYIEAWDLNDKLYTLQEAKEHLGIEDYGTKEHPHNMGYDERTCARYDLVEDDDEDLGTEQQHIENFFKLNEEVQEEYDEAYKELEKTKKKKK